MKSLKPKQKSKDGTTSGDVKTPVSPTTPKFPIPAEVKMNEKEKGIAERVLRLMTLKIPVNKEPPTGKKVNRKLAKYKHQLDILDG